MGIVDEIRADREAGAKRLEAEYKDRLMAFACRLGADSTEAEALVYRTFEVAVAGIDAYANRSAFYSWLCGILVNCYGKATRGKVKSATTPVAGFNDLSDESDGEGRIFTAVDAGIVREAIETLPPAMKESIVLHYFMDLPLGKVARYLSLPLGTVKSRLHYARLLLAERLGAALPKSRGAKAVAVAALFAACASLAALVVNEKLRVESEESTESRPAATENLFSGEQKGEKNMIITRKVASIVGASLMAVSAPAAELQSERTFVFLRSETSSFWNTATNNTMTVPIDLPSGASSAALTVSGLGYSATYDNLTGGEFTFNLPAADSPGTENVYDLTLTFDNGVVRTAKLGLVQGLQPGTQGSTRCLAPSGSKVWNRVVGKAVLPIPYGTTSFTVNGVTADTGLNGAQGWYALGGINPNEAVSLSLVAGGVEYAASLLGGGAGMMMIFK